MTLKTTRGGNKPEVKTELQQLLESARRVEDEDHNKTQANFHALFVLATYYMSTLWGKTQSG